MKLLTIILAAYTLLSPNGKIETTIQADRNNAPAYSVAFDGNALTEMSPVSMTLADGKVLGTPGKPKSVKKGSVDATVNAVIYKKKTVRDHYNWLRLSYKDFDIEFRAYDEGVAYRFTYTSKTDFKVKSEQAEFRFAKDWQTRAAYVRDTGTYDQQWFQSFENTYTVAPLSGWEKGHLAFLPIMVEADGCRICLSETDLLDYPGMYLDSKDGAKTLKGVYAPYPDEIEQAGHNKLQGVVKTHRDYIAQYNAGKVSFPWRIIAVADDDARLAEADLPWLLARPDDGRDWSWIKPGKVAWDWWNDWNIYNVDFEAGINNRTYEYYIDFASANGIEYVILDEGWAVNLQADLMQVIPEIDLPHLCSYAAERGVGIVLWAGYWAFNRDMEGVCAHYSKMGVKGWKIDFMDRDDQPMVEFITKAAEIAARYNMFVDFHGMYKPAGVQRTWPNVLNFEGVHGLEQMKWERDVKQVDYDVNIPFIRMYAGPMDYTQGAMRNATKGNYKPVYTEPMSQGTRCRQLAEYIIFDAPFTMLCDSPSNYLAEPECTGLIASIPTVWDNTLAISGKVGEYIAMAREKDGVWYASAITNWDARTLDIKLDFLPAGSWKVTLFQDGPNAAKAARDYVKKEFTVNSGDSFNIPMAPGGGWIARFEAL